MPKINRSVKDNSTVNNNEMTRAQELVKFMYKPIMIRTSSYKNFYYKTETLQKLRVFPLLERKNLILLARIHFSLLYLDERLVIPKDMPENMFTALHSGHAGRDALLREAAVVWWPKIHREIEEKANICLECTKTCKNSPRLKNQMMKLLCSLKALFKMLRTEKKYTLISIDSISGWPEALFSTNPTTERVLELLPDYIAQHGIPQKRRTDPGTAFKVNNSKNFEKKTI